MPETLVVKKRSIETELGKLPPVRGRLFLEKEPGNEKKISNKIGGNWSIEELFGELSKKIMSGEKIKKNEWILWFDSQYSAIRINGKDEFGNVVAFSLWVNPETKKINKICRYDIDYDTFKRFGRDTSDDTFERFHFINIILTFKDCGIFVPDITERLGISKDELDSIKEEYKKIKKSPLMQKLLFSKNEIRGNWSIEELFGELSKKIMSGEKIKKNEWILWFDSQYSAIRINGKDEFGNVVAFSLWVNPETKKINRIGRYDTFERSQFINIMLKFENCGIFVPDITERLGISKDELDSIKEEYEEFARLNKKLDEINRSPLENLPSSDNYTGKNTQPVHQGEGVIFDPKESNIDGLYTFGAEPCSILIVISRAPDGKINKIGMAHLDNEVPVNDITKFINRVKEGVSGVEAYVIGGERDISLKVLEVLEATRSEIKFFNPNLKRVLEVLEATRSEIKFFNPNLKLERSDAAVVDSKGNVYYGERMDLNDSIFDREKFKMIAAERQASGKLYIID